MARISKLLTNAAYERLVRANPVSPSDLGNVTGRFTADEGVQMVLDRAARQQQAMRRPSVSRMRLVFVSLVLTFPLLVGTAFALDARIVDFLRSPAPDQRTQEIVFSLAEGAPTGMDAGLLPESARLIGDIDGRDLWVAPTDGGGMCFGWVGSSGGCDRLGTVPLDVSVGYSDDRRSVRHLSGFMNSRFSERLEVLFRDGEVVRPQLLKVSSPIDAAFFSYDVPRSRQNSEAAAVAVRVADSEGNLVSERGIPLSHLPLPDPIKDALVSESRTIKEIRIRDGSASIVTAPTRYGGECAWAEVAGKRRFLAPCRAAKSSFDMFSVQPISTESTVVLAGTASERFSRVAVTFADGEREQIASTDGFFLYQVPADHLTVDARPTSVEAVDSAGTVAGRIPIGGQGSCWSGLPTELSPRPADCPNAVELHGQ